MSLICQCSFNFLLISLSLSHNPFILEGKSLFPIAGRKQHYIQWRAWLQQICVCAWCSNWFPFLAGWDLCQGWLALLYIRSLREQPNLHTMKLISRFPAPLSGFSKHSAACHMTSDWPTLTYVQHLSNYTWLWYTIHIEGFIFFNSCMSLVQLWTFEDI